MMRQLRRGRQSGNVELYSIVEWDRRRIQRMNLAQFVFHELGEQRRR